MLEGQRDSLYNKPFSNLKMSESSKTRNQNTNPEKLESKVLQLQLISALSSNNIDSILSTILKININTNTEQSYGSPLHLLVTLASVDIIKTVVYKLGELTTRERTASNKSTTSTASQHNEEKENINSKWINSLNQDKETPLHLASKLGRADVLEILFQLNNVDDTIRNVAGKTPQDLAKDASITKIFENYKNDHINVLVSAMKNAIQTNDHSNLEFIFDNSKRSQAYLQHGWLDINQALDAESERSFLHLAAKNDNLELVVWGLKYGADPSCADKKGKKPIEMAKSEAVKDILKHAKFQASVVSSTLSQVITAESPTNAIREPPVLKGYLSKWTNLKDGYQQRYFVLENGVLSYYQTPDDYPLACKGSIPTSAITAHFGDSKNHPARFEVMAGGSIKFYLKARSAADAKKWVWALMESRTFLTDSKAKPNLSHSTSDVFVSENNDATPSVQYQLHNVADIVKADDGEDLQSYLEKHPTASFNTPELKRLFVLLRTEMDAQKETVQTVAALITKMIENEGDQPTVSELIQLPSLLADSSLQIEALIFGIVKAMNKREVQLEGSLERAEFEIKKYQDLFAQLEIDYKDDKKRLDVDRPVEKDNDTNSFETSDDEFYDAVDMTITGSIDKGDEFFEAQEQVYSEKVVVPTIDSPEYRSLFPIRTQLPFDPSLPMPTLAVWSFLKSAIGKDLSKISLPVLFNEPLSMLQRFCEDVEYIELLTVASMIGGPCQEAAKPIITKYSEQYGIKSSTIETSDEDDDLLRMAMVAAFAVSNYSSTVNRTSKPFNPMLVTKTKPGRDF
jgi:ankyrin repeat protein